MKIVSVFIPGLPKTKGSMEHVGGGKMRESVEGSTRWKRIMAGLIHDQYRRSFSAPYPGPCSVLADAYFDCTGEDLIREGATGDTDKLMRNVMDALKDAGAYIDDAQVVDERLRKWAIRDYPLHPNQGLMVTVYAGRMPQ